MFLHINMKVVAYNIIMSVCAVGICHMGYLWETADMLHECIDIEPHKY